MLFAQWESKRHVCFSFRFIRFIVNVKKKCDLKDAAGMSSKRKNKF